MCTECMTEQRIPETWKEATNYGDNFQEREQKTLLAIKYVQTVHTNHNNYTW